MLLRHGVQPRRDLEGGCIPRSDFAFLVARRSPLPASGGTARRFYHQAARDHRLRSPLDDEQFAALNACADPGEDFVRIVENLINNDPRSIT